jgi:hypothetical protein
MPNGIKVLVFIFGFVLIFIVALAIAAFNPQYIGTVLFCIFMIMTLVIAALDMLLIRILYRGIQKGEVVIFSKWNINNETVRKDLSPSRYKFTVILDAFVCLVIAAMVVICINASFLFLSV